MKKKSRVVVFGALVLATLAFGTAEASPGPREVAPLAGRGIWGVLACGSCLGLTMTTALTLPALTSVVGSGCYAVCVAEL